MIILIFKLKCRFSGKECVSELLTELVADDSKLKSILENNRANGWKYFIKEKWERSSIATLFNGSYPEDNAGLPYWP